MQAESNTAGAGIERSRAANRLRGGTGRVLFDGSIFAAIVAKFSPFGYGIGIDRRFSSGVIYDSNTSGAARVFLRGAAGKIGGKSFPDRRFFPLRSPGGPGDPDQEREMDKFQLQKYIDAEPNAKLRDVVMTTPALDSYNVPWVVSKFTVEDYMPGDVNGDKLVNVVDVAGVVNLILNSGNTAQLNRKAADINGDGTINVVDVAGVVNIILRNTNNARLKMPTRAGSDAALYFYLTPSDIPQGETSTMHIKLQSDEDSFTGCQFDLYLPEGLSVAEEDGFPLVEIGSGTTTRRHTVSTLVQPDGALRVVCYSNNNSVFSDTETGSEILTAAIKVASDAPLGQCTIALRNITLSRPDVTGASLDDWDATCCAVIASGINDIEADVVSGAPVFSLSGQRLTAPRKGVNIVGGCKVVVK